MVLKNIILKEETRILYNVVCADILAKNPKIKRLTDDLAIRLILKKYLEVFKNGSSKKRKR